MATSHNLPPSETDWVHELAKNELNPENANIFNLSNQFDPKQIIEENTIQFLEELRNLFQLFAKLFNSHSQNNEKFNDIKTYGITNTPADFMLFRNNVKLIFSNSAHGVITATFTQHARDPKTVTGLTENIKQSHDILAQTGPFLDVTWTYQGERVNPLRLVKYYFVEFVKASRIAKKESTNQFLLQQIKALLQDKGIDL